MSKTNQRLAIAVIGLDYQTKYDPRYVRLVAHTYDGEDMTFLNFHSCTDEDMA